MARRLLIIEDERKLLDILIRHFSDAGYEVDYASDGVEGFAQAISRPWDLIIVNLNVPRLGGLDICRQVSKKNPEIPLILVSVPTTEAQLLEAYSAGADDFVCIPFCTHALVAKVNALFRRMDIQQERVMGSDCVVAANLVIDKRMHTVCISGDYVELTPREFSLLECFAQSPGKVFTRRELLDTVWGYDHACYLHIVNTHINRLRKKLRQHKASENLIETVWGVGYKFVYVEADKPINTNSLTQSASSFSDR